MKSLFRAALLVGAVIAAPMTAAADPLTHEQLKAMLTGLGYTPKEVGETAAKVEITLVTPSFNVPMGAELTKSGRFVWLTANLGTSNLTGDQALQLLKRSSEWQPTQFWITSSNTLTIGIAINNTDIKPDALKFALEKLGGDVGKSSDIWQAPASQ